MRLRELKAEFLRIESRGVWRLLGPLRTPEAEGVWFLCPKCFAANKGEKGTHSVICWFTGVDPDIDPKPGRWNPEGLSIDDLTFIGPGQVSVRLDSSQPCAWHGYVVGGDAT